MRRFFSIFLLFLVFLGADELSKQSKNLKENERIQKQLSKKLEDLASEILNNEKKLAQLAKQIQSASTAASQLEERAKNQKDELKELSQQNTALLKDRNLMESKLVSLIAKDFAYDLPIPKGYLESKDSFMAFEILQSLDLVLSEEFYRLSKDYENISKSISQKQIQIRQINTNLKEYNNKILELTKLKKNQEEELAKQKTDKAIYTQKLKDLEAQQNELRQTLASLQIIQKPKTPPQNLKQTQPALNENQEIRQLGSSYQESSVKRYKGAKTIAPLDSFSVKQKFGNYTDPVYNIKLFNENVVLRSKTPDARVKSILNGKVVFAKETNLLQKVVIVEHADGMHTIYAHLDKIAPTIKTGINIKKGTIIGRVKNDLTFEVTQEKFHINPLELISLN